mgnify:CR=1 FL=1
MTTKRWRIAVGGDIAGMGYKDMIRRDLESDERVAAVIDVGVSDDTAKSTRYPSVAHEAAELVAAGEADRAILICGTGIGMSMVANRFRNVRAALCSDPFSARLSRQHNDANILVLGGRMLGETMALETIDAWLNTGFDGGRHQKRLEMFNRSGQESS